MVVVNGIVTTTEADIGSLREAIAAMERASREEQGCIDYTFSVEVSDPNVLRITEKWDNVDALMAHMATPHMAEFQKTMGTHPPVSMEVCFYEAQEIHPFG